MTETAERCVECLQQARQWVPDPHSLDALIGFCSDTCREQYERRQAVGEPAAAPDRPAPRPGAT